MPIVILPVERAKPMRSTRYSHKDTYIKQRRRLSSYLCAWIGSLNAGYKLTSARSPFTHTYTRRSVYPANSHRIPLYTIMITSTLPCPSSAASARTTALEPEHLLLSNPTKPSLFQDFRIQRLCRTRVIFSTPRLERVTRHLEIRQCSTSKARKLTTLNAVPVKPSSTLASRSWRPSPPS